MNSKDINNIKTLFYFENYTEASLARLYGISRQRMNKILWDTPVTFEAGDECRLCGTENSQTFYIDGDAKNNKPSNKIILCEGHKRELMHLQLRRRDKQGILKPQFQPDRLEDDA